MRITKLAEIAEMGADEPVLAVQGTITAVYQRKAGGAGEKTWAFQVIKVKDDTGEVRVKLWGRDELPKSITGRGITITATQHAKNKSWHGIKTEEDNYKDRHEMILNVSESAEVAIGEGTAGEDAPPAKKTAPIKGLNAPAPAPKAPESAPAEAPEAPPAKEQAPPEESAPPRQGTALTTEEQAAKRLHAITTAQKYVNRRANGLALCMRAGKYLGEQFQGTFDEPMPAEFLQGWTTSLFISLDRSGLIDALPTGDLAKLLTDLEAAQPTIKDLAKRGILR